jgi:hypothetical protein
MKLPARLVTSSAWSRITQCFQSEVLEVLVHPLRATFNGSDDHVNCLCRSQQCARREGVRGLTVPALPGVRPGKQARQKWVAVQEVDAS